ncbi:MAG: DUF6320 domain-containing protein [Bacteroidales bacterium]
MKTCNYCGVELENSMNFCPLCGEPLMDKDHEKTEYIQVRKRQQEEKLLTPYQKLTVFQKLKIFWQISAIIFISGILVTLVIDLLANNAITWSKYPIAACVVLFINTTLITFLYKRMSLLLIGSFISTSGLLLLIDMFDKASGWSVKIGVPILLAAYIIVVLLVKLIKKVEQKSLNVIAYSLISAGLLSICTEVIISLYSKNQLHIEWSLIVMISVLVISAILLYIHFKLRKGIDLKRFFHI